MARIFTMKNHRLLLTIFTFVCSFCVYADQSQYTLYDEETQAYQPHRIAIIGAGAAGSSAAYYLQRHAAAQHLSTPLNVTVFDLNPRVGGRTTTVNAFDDPAYPVELGASIFVRINHILYNASREFNLQTSLYDEGETGSDYDLGVWNGETFVFKTSIGSGRWQGYWDIAKLLWKYGMAPIKTQKLMKSTVGKFLKFYEEPVFPFSSLDYAVMQTELLDFTAANGVQTLKEGGIGEAFGRDVIQASTRVNYGQNLGVIHGLESMVCMATDGAMAIEGGNWQIFDEAIKRSKAGIQLDTTVTDVEKDDKGLYHIHTNTTANSQPFDTVILAAPYQYADITFSPPLAVTPKKIPYVSLHVTLLTTPHLASPSFFNLDPSLQTSIPDTILTTLPADLDMGTTQGSSSVGPANFWSINVLRTISPSTHSNTTQYLYKIFSPSPMTGTFLSSLFAIPYSNTSAADPISDLSKNDITWYHEKVWNSYPYETPRSSFEEIKLDSTTASGTGVWYTSGMESFISTMETSALMGMNVARLIVDEIAASEPLAV